MTGAVAVGLVSIPVTHPLTFEACRRLRSVSCTAKTPNATMSATEETMVEMAAQSKAFAPPAADTGTTIA
jgi:hypothetical protein